MGEQINRITTEVRRTRALGEDAHCPECGFSQPMALRKRDKRCYECGNAAAGRATIENHHPTGEANDPHTTVPTPANMHGLLDARKAAWPQEVRENPMHDPLTAIIQVTYATRDFALVIADYAQQIGDWLVRLRDALIVQWGAMWQIVLGLPPLWGNAAA
jgi:hypothetical protein